MSNSEVSLLTQWLSSEMRVAKGSQEFQAIMGVASGPLERGAVPWYVFREIIHIALKQNKNKDEIKRLLGYIEPGVLTLKNKGVTPSATSDYIKLLAYELSSALDIFAKSYETSSVLTAHVFLKIDAWENALQNYKACEEDYWDNLSEDDKVSLLQGLAIIYAGQRKFELVKEKLKKALMIEPNDGFTQRMLSIPLWEPDDERLMMPMQGMPDNAVSLKLYTGKEVFIKYLETKLPHFAKLCNQLEQDLKTGKIRLVKDHSSGKIMVSASSEPIAVRSPKKWWQFWK